MSETGGDDVNAVTSADYCDEGMYKFAFALLLLGYVILCLVTLLTLCGCCVASCCACALAAGTLAGGLAGGLTGGLTSFVTGGKKGKTGDSDEEGEDERPSSSQKAIVEEEMNAAA